MTSVASGIKPIPVITLISPLRVPQTTSKDFILNLNHYRNAHYRTLNTVKKRYKEIMQEQILTLPRYDRIGLMFTLYPKNRQLTDVANVCSVHEKFFADALVELGKLEDDNYLFLPETGYRFGDVDPENGRVEISIHPLSIGLDI